MALKQSRRTVSISRPVFNAAKKLAKRKNQSLAYFVEIALRAAGVKAKIGAHVTAKEAHRARTARLNRRGKIRPSRHVEVRTIEDIVSAAIDKKLRKAGIVAPVVDAVAVEAETATVRTCGACGSPCDVKRDDAGDVIAQCCTQCSWKWEHYTSPTLVRSEQRLPGPIRRALGDEIANMCGEPERVVNRG